MSFSAGPTCVSMDILYEKDDLHDARNSQDRGQSLHSHDGGLYPKLSPPCISTDFLPCNRIFGVSIACAYKVSLRT